uniref:alpha/beta fold hydrolase n=1 Tax=Glutamicibacter sp. AOP38-B1-38 TaxID=3457680 RepID=UPI001C3EE84F
MRTAPSTNPNSFFRPNRAIQRHIGVRYARLQDGQRFDPPSLVPLSEGLAASAQFDSTEDVPVFPQLTSRLDTFMGSPAGKQIHDQDAFFLNTFAPEGLTDLPVLVFVHGGAWVSGAGTFSWYEGDEIACEGVCVVSVNYRIHATAHLSDSAEHRPLQDLETALEWVQRNIQHFGGNPENVTLVGQSAGGWYVHALSQLERLRGKFRRIALLSMGTRTPWSRQQLEATRQQISLANNGAELGEIPTDKLLADSISCSRAVLQPELASAPVGYTPAPLLPTASIDLPTDFLDPLSSTKNLIVDDVFLRYTLDETGIFLCGSAAAIKATAEQVENSYRAFIPDPSTVPEHLHRRMVDTKSNPYLRLRAITSWAQFQELPTLLASAYSSAGKNVQLHEFNVPSSNTTLGSCHCLDLPYQFGNFHAWKDAPMLTGVNPEDFAAISKPLIKQMTDYVRG